MENSSDQSFWQFSDQLRLQSSSFANLSLNDSIWSHTCNNNSNSFTSKRPEERRNFDIRVGAERTFSSSSSSSSNDGIKQKGGFSEINNRFYENGWNVASGFGSLIGEGEAQKNFNFNVDVNGGFNKGIYSKLYDNGGYKKSNNNGEQVGKLGKKNSKNKEANNNDNSSNISNNSGNRGKNSSADKRFKTLPPSESLPRGEAVGGYIFVCNNDTMQENLKRQLFGLPPRYRDSVRAIRPGLPLFLYNYSTHQLHGIFEASSFGGTNIDPTAWEDKKCLGESRFPAQVRVVTRQICEPMEEDSFRPVLHHYDGPKFRLELNIPEALALLDIFAQKYNEKGH